VPDGITRRRLAWSQPENGIFPRMKPVDTSTKAFAHQILLYRKVGAAGRSKIAAELSDAVRATTLSAIRRRHPDYSEGEVARRFLSAVYRVAVK
jgi:hypothetical protein